MEDAMCHHFNAFGKFQSGQYPNMQPDEIVLSFRDSAAIEALHVFADLTDDDDLAMAIVKQLDAIVAVRTVGKGDGPGNGQPDRNIHRKPASHTTWHNYTVDTRV
jgi:hypothetical protein